MKNKHDSLSDSENSKTVKTKKSAGETVSKILVVACIAAAVILIVLTAIAFINSGRDTAPETGALAPEIITTVPTTTALSADSVKIKGDVYAKEEADVLTEPSENAEKIARLNKGDAVGFVSVDKNGWCKIVYDEKVYYVNRKYLTAKKPAETTLAEGATDATQESGSEAQNSTTPTGVSSRKVVDPEQKRWSLVVVDKTRQMPDGYEPSLTVVANSEHSLDSRAASSYDNMYNAAYEEGIVLTPYSGYRSVSTQESNYNALVNELVNEGYSQQEAEDKAATEILPAGCSEHNLGLAMDICSIEDSFGDSDEYKWLCENAYLYGFIERYPADKQTVTGVIPEPWHWRFVGPAHAKKMKQEGIATLEEYLQKYGVDY